MKEYLPIALQIIGGLTLGALIVRIPWKIVSWVVSKTLGEPEKPILPTVKPLRTSSRFPKVNMSDKSVDFLRKQGVSDFDIGRLDAYSEIVEMIETDAWKDLTPEHVKNKILWRQSNIENAASVGIWWKNGEFPPKEPERKY